MYHEISYKFYTIFNRALREGLEKPLLAGYFSRN